MSKPLRESELQAQYDEMLDEIYPEVQIAGLNYSTSHALREVDPTAYRCGFADWLDSELRDGGLFEQAGEYYTDDPADDADEN